MNGQGLQRSRAVWPLGELILLSGLCAWVFWSHLAGTVHQMSRSGAMAHGLIAPLGVALLIYFRRRDLLARPMRGSGWGIAFILAALLVVAAATWPFNYTYARRSVFVIALAGAVLVACGWRVLKLSVPMLLLVLLAIPISTRFYMSLTFHLEGWTLAVAAKLLRLLPGVIAGVHGGQLVLGGARAPYVLGLGGPRWVTETWLAFAAIGVFVAFARVRSRRRVAFLVATALPLVLLCNLFRLLCWAAVAVYGRADLTSSVPRYVSTILSLLVAYGAFALAASGRLNLPGRRRGKEDGPEGHAQDPRPDTPGRVGGLRGCLSPRLVVSVAILAAAAVGLTPAVRKVREALSKKPIAIRRSIRDFDPASLPSYRSGWKYHRGPRPVEALGTEECVRLEFRKEKPDGPITLVGLSVTYYSKPGDKIPHTPDVCALQAGAVLEKTDMTTVSLPATAGAPRQIQARVLYFAWKDQKRVVVCSFVAEGQFVPTRRQARWLVARPGNRYTYNGLIMTEAQYERDEDRDEAIEACKTMLAETAPVLLADYLPTAEQIKGP